MIFKIFILFRYLFYDNVKNQMNKKIPALFDSDSSSKKQKARSPLRLNSPRYPYETTTNIKVFARFRPSNK